MNEMKYILTIITSTLLFYCAQGQTNLETLTVEKIMRDPKWIGSSPSQLQWNTSSDTLFFLWNPTQADNDSLYFITLKDNTPKPYHLTKQNKNYDVSRIYNELKTAFVEEIDNDIYYTHKGIKKRITQTIARESNPRFSFDGRKIVYALADNLFSWDIASGATEQLTNFQTQVNAEPAAAKGTAQEESLKKEQLALFQVLEERKENADKRKLAFDNLRTIPLTVINTKGKSASGLAIDYSGRYVAYRLSNPPARGKSTIVPTYVTESGYTETIPTRSKVGVPTSSSEASIYDRLEDSVYSISLDELPGLSKAPEYLKDYNKDVKDRKKNINISTAQWSPTGNTALMEIRSSDNKDRWLAIWSTDTKKIIVADHQHNEAWIGGPGSFSNAIGWINDSEFYYRSEASGYAHLYTYNINTKNTTTLTQGKYEIQEAELSIDKKYFYLSTNEVHPGERQFYKLNIATKEKTRLTQMTGANDVALSPDEKNMAFLYSYINKPWELYLQPNKEKSTAVKITNKSISAEWASYPWRDAELITFKAADGEDVYARVYKPKNPKPGAPAVLFVHGAGYLQNAHKWWSSYFREYMFNNLLADNGYYVMDIDYRASAGYGEKWRTGIYRHMGGKDLSDHVDAVNYMVKNLSVDPKKVGLYGGSYGGFITLMGLFTEPEVFKSGAALRPVTDWANYNHGYTSNILNEPNTDSIAYRKSSPIYFAEGLKGHLLICHGMVDVNVHYQDAVKLSQRLIELGKNNWELASYPMEDHGFVEPSSWTDEYKRIFKLFESTLK